MQLFSLMQLFLPITFWLPLQLSAQQQPFQLLPLLFFFILLQPFLLLQLLSFFMLLQSKLLLFQLLQLSSLQLQLTISSYFLLYQLNVY